MLVVDAPTHHVVGEVKLDYIIGVVDAVISMLDSDDMIQVACAHMSMCIERRGVREIKKERERERERERLSYVHMCYHVLECPMRHEANLVEWCVWTQSRDVSGLLCADCLLLGACVNHAPVLPFSRSVPFCKSLARAVPLFPRARFIDTDCLHAYRHQEAHTSYTHVQGVVNGYTPGTLPSDTLAPASQSTRSRLRSFIEQSLAGPAEGVEAGLDASARCVHNQDVRSGPLALCANFACM